MNKKVTIYGQHLIDPAAISQLYDCMKHPDIVQGALMPDAHLGYSLPIGGVVTSKGVIFPSFVGYDIGCGMCAINVNNVSVNQITDHWEEIIDLVTEYIPVGFNHHNTPLTILQPNITGAAWDIYQSKNGDCQLGSLGGGNHFIEIGFNENGKVFITIHSGSRGVGHGIGEYYMKIAAGTDKASEGNYGLDVNSEEGKNYIRDMNFCLEYALRNRILMIESVVKAIQNSTGYGSPDYSGMINRNHNHATYRDGLWIHRKGATHAEKDMLGVIPGNCSDGVFIVRGKGNPDSMYSSSHGAGRLLGRNQAKKTLDFETYQKKMDGIKCRISMNTLDESPDAYKNIFDVMEAQKDLVDIIDHVKPLISIKG